LTDLLSTSTELHLNKMVNQHAGRTEPRINQTANAIFLTPM
jgi:hypothetical protein